MEKKRKSRSQMKGVIMGEKVLGTWRLPSGNEVKGTLLHSQNNYGMHMNIGNDYPFHRADLDAYAGFIMPEAQRLATLLVEKGLTTRTPGERVRQRTRRVKRT